MSQYAAQIRALRRDLATTGATTVAFDRETAEAWDADDRHELGRLIVAAAEVGQPFRILSPVADGFAFVLASVGDKPMGRRCRVCGCTDLDCRACIWRTDEPCVWVERDLCSACRPYADLDADRPEVATADA